MLPIISTALATALRSEDPQARDRGSFLLGGSALTCELLAHIETIARRSATVLIDRETGVGKEVAAREIHARSLRAAKLFVPVDCTAISIELIESQLFGHVKGAFTGAVGAAMEFIRCAVAWSSDVADFTIDLTQLAAGNNLGSANCSGWVYTFTGTPAISNATVDPSSTLPITSLSFTANSIAVNYAGQGVVTSNVTTRLNVTFVPEPGGVALVGIGVCGFTHYGLRRQRRKRQTAPRADAKATAHRAVVSPSHHRTGPARPWRAPLAAMCERRL